MYSQGNWYPRIGKRLVNDCHSVRASKLKELFLLAHEKGEGFEREGRLEWRNDNSIGLKVESRHSGLWVHFFYRLLKSDQSIKESVKVEHTRPHFGGFRWWFLCPRCDKRVATLLRPLDEARFACRTCHDLTYRSTRNHPSDKRWSRMVELRRMVDPNDGGRIFDPFPERPKYFHHDKYWKLKWEYHNTLNREWEWVFTYIGSGAWFYRRMREKRQYRDEEIAKGEAQAEREEAARQRAKEPKRGTLGEVARRANVPYEFAKQLVAHDLIRPDGGRGTRVKRYRLRLASWIEKLHMLNQFGYSFDDLKAWTKRRFKAGHEHERRYPEGFSEG